MKERDSLCSEAEAPLPNEDELLHPPSVGSEEKRIARALTQKDGRFRIRRLLASVFVAPPPKIFQSGPTRLTEHREQSRIYIEIQQDVKIYMRAPAHSIFSSRVLLVLRLLG